MVIGKKLPLIDFKKKGFGADAEILVSAAKNGARISEEKVSVIYDTGSRTSTNCLDPIF